MTAPTVLYADVLLSLHLRQLYTYRIEPELAQHCQPGQRVVVQFGARRYYTAIVWRVHSEAPTAGPAKPIDLVLDNQPLLAPLHLRFWEWMAHYYLAPLGDVMRAALPATLKLESESMLRAVPEWPGSDTPPKPNEQEIFGLLSQHALPMKEVLKRSSAKAPLAVVKRMIDRGQIEIDEALDSPTKPKNEKRIGLHPSICTEAAAHALLDQLRRAPRQQQAMEHLLLLLHQAGIEPQAYPTARWPKSSLANLDAIGAPTIKELVRKGLLVEEEVEIGRIKTATATADLPQLSHSQQQALDQIHAHWQHKQVVLLHGITGSGKTEIYIRLIAQTVAQDKQVLYLLPEIALTTQIIRRLQTVFGPKIGVYHSRFNQAERAEIWQHVLDNNQAPGQRPHQIVVGVRSAIFLPQQHLGLIVVDEEHETSFKQHDPAPRYHARDAAIVLAQLHGAKVLLGSASPSAESYYNAQQQKYGLVSLNSRFGPGQLPEIELIDTHDAAKRKRMRSMFSVPLLEHIQAAVAQGQQCILFQNRRGYAPYVQCSQCASIVRCKHCDVSLTYHLSTRSLSCHYCGYSQGIDQACAHCGSTHLQAKGFGTEKIEDELQALLPQLRVARLDMDSTRRKYAFEDILARFEQGHIDVLVGTQMVAKGLDFEKVALVGILDADTMLSFPDFRTNERAYQTMLQVSGRAGRKDNRGKVLIQTTQPQHPVVQQVLQANTTGMLENELAERQHFLYPPFVRLIRLVLKHKQQSMAQSAARKLAAAFIQLPGIAVLGPEPGLIPRLQGLYVEQILIKIIDRSQLDTLKTQLLQHIQQAEDRGYLQQCRVLIDVDPYN